MKNIPKHKIHKTSTGGALWCPQDARARLSRRSQYTSTAIVEKNCHIPNCSHTILLPPLHDHPPFPWLKVKVDSYAAILVVVSHRHCEPIHRAAGRRMSGIQRKHTSSSHLHLYPVAPLRRPIAAAHTVVINLDLAIAEGPQRANGASRVEHVNEADGSNGYVPESLWIVHHTHARTHAYTQTSAGLIWTTYSIGCCKKQTRMHQNT